MRPSYALAAAFALCFAPAGQARAGETPGRTLTVNATGQASARPDAMYIRLVAEAGGDTAADALQQCRKNADEAAKAIAVLNVENAAIERKMYKFAGPGSGDPYGMRQADEATEKAKVSQLIEIKVSKIQLRKKEELAEVLAKVLDAAGKAEVKLAESNGMRARMSGEVGPAAVEYALEDATALRETALKDALARAKAAVGSLEGLGVKVGKLRSVDCSTREVPESYAIWTGLASAGGPKPQKAAYSADPDQVTVSVSLTVTHELGE